MDQGLLLLVGTAFTVGLVHTILGPDHYIPFVALAEARHWSLRKTMIITGLCGLGHVLGSIALGAVGIALGWAMGSLEAFEGSRANWTAWALIGFGLAYGIWGLLQAFRRKRHSHPHVHQDGTVHVHSHNHLTEHAHVHDGRSRASITPWMLFIIFVLGPCEPLIPLLMVPASQHSWAGVGIVSLVFAATTILTMCAIVSALSAGISFVRSSGLDRWTHALAGLSLVLCGAAMKWLGL
jgi:sulfite exporter TauE/SafE